MKDRLRKIYHSSPLIVIKSYKALYYAWNKIRSCWLPVHLYKGNIRDGGKTLVFSYVGRNDEILSYWLKRIFVQYEKLPGKKMVPAWKVNRLSNGKVVQADIAIVELLNIIALRLARNGSGFVIPRWFKNYLDVDLSLAIINKRNSIHRRIRKFSLEPEIAKSSSDFRYFYKRMYKPYVESRHRDSAYIEDYKKMLDDFRKKNSTLYFISKDSRRIAGLYEINPDGIPHLYGVGVLDGGEKIMKMGVIGALYYYALSLHRDNNIKRVDIGGTSPLLSDGLTSFKISLGAKASEIERQDSLRLLMLPLRNSPAVMDFLKSNPFIYIENNNVNCAMFKDGTSPGSEEEFQMLYKKAGALNLNEIKRLYLNTNQKEFTFDLKPVRDEAC